MGPRCSRYVFYERKSFGPADSRTPDRVGISAVPTALPPAPYGKGKFHLEQATNVQRGNRAIALFFINLGTRWRWVVNVTPRPLYPRKAASTHCVGGWAGPRDRCRKSRLHRDSITGSFCPQRVSIPTELSRPISPAP